MHVVMEVGAVSVGGPQSWICDIAPALKKRGVDVTVISFGSVMPHQDVMRERLQEEGITARRIVLRGTKWEKWRAVGDGMRSVGKCEIAHFNSDVYSGWIMPFAKRQQIPVRILHSRTPNWKCGSRRFGDRLLYGWFKWQARRCCTHVFGVTREALVAATGPSRKSRVPCEVVPSAIRSDRFSCLIERHAVVRSGASAQNFVIGFIGRMVASKHPRKLVEIVALLRERGVNASVVFMGAGPEEKAVAEMASQIGIRAHVTLLAPEANVGEVFAEQMDVLMLPSDYEGTPRVIVEAQACGLPVICSTAVSSDVSIVPELFHRVDLAADCGAWAEKAQEACATRVSRERVQFCFAGSSFEIEGQADWLLNYYRRCLGL